MEESNKKQKAKQVINENKFPLQVFLSASSDIEEEMIIERFS
jgi:hypothetical protein